MARTYTKQDVPHDMDPDDHQRMVALGRGMANRNGYRAEQGSDLAPRLSVGARLPLTFDPQRRRPLKIPTPLA